jgi:PhnB protein
MASRLNPYISFNGDARDAMEFYRSVFGGELSVSTFGEFGQPDGPGSDTIMHAQLETPAGFTLMASDTPPGMDYSAPNSSSRAEPLLPHPACPQTDDTCRDQA